MDVAVAWLRTDLRLHDNPVLADAVATADAVLPLHVLEHDADTTGMFGFPKVGPHRARFHLESLRDLRAGLRERDGDLLVRRGDPTRVVPEVAAAVGADAVFAQTRPATEEFEAEHAVRDGLAERGIDLERRWTHTLYHVEDLPHDVADAQDTFTPWRKAVERGTEIRATVPRPETVPYPATAPAPGRDGPAVPTLRALGYDPAAATADDRGVLAFEGGETAGLARLHDYVWAGDHLRRYKSTRNGLLGPDFSSKLSPWLALGCLSPRRVAEAIERYEDDRVANDSTYWLRFELTWRDFFHVQFAKHGTRLFTPGGIRDRDIDWAGGGAAFDRWAEGRTGIPFVDAAMRELNATGYQSNRARQNAASLLANDLRVDWRRGAAYFESRLVDHDVCSNWGNWAYVAGVGNDSRDRRFDVVSQARRYDAEGGYVRTWVPELADLPAEAVHEPWTLSRDQQAAFGVVLGEEYPRPVTDRYR